MSTYKVATTLVALRGCRHTDVTLLQGFVARRTELSARIQSYHKLLQETRGMLSPPPSTSQPDYISAADLGTERDPATRKRKQKQRVTSRGERKRNQSQSPRLEEAGDKKNWHEQDVITTEPTTRTTNEAFFCDNPREKHDLLLIN